MPEADLVQSVRAVSKPIAAAIRPTVAHQIGYANEDVSILSPFIRQNPRKNSTHSRSPIRHQRSERTHVAHSTKTYRKEILMERSVNLEFVSILSPFIRQNPHKNSTHSRSPIRHQRSERTHVKHSTKTYRKEILMERSVNLEFVESWRTD